MIEDENIPEPLEPGDPPIPPYIPEPPPPQQYPSLPPAEPAIPVEGLDVYWLVFDPINGRILRTGRSMSEERALAQGPEGCVLLDVTADDVNDYVVDGVVTPRPELPEFDKYEILADDTDVATIVLPPGSIVTLDGEQYVIEDGMFEFAADVAASYEIKISNAWPYQDGSCVIEAVEEIST